MLQLNVFGTPEARHGGEPVTFATRKAQALLAFLAVEGRRQSREKLTALFWPESDGERGRAALRQALTLLLEALRSNGCREPTSHVLVQRDALAFDFSRNSVVDFQVIERLLSETSADSPPSAQARLLREAVGLYRGEFLEGFSVNGAPDFDDWASVLREKWHRKIGGILQQLVELNLDAGQIDEATETAARWVAHDRWDEGAHRRLIELHLQRGDRVAARRAYEACVSTLMDELGVDPDPETSRLSALILTQAKGGGRAIRSIGLWQGAEGRDAPANLLDPPTVGRANEQSVLRAAFDDVAAGSTRVIAIRGDPGLGKTHLANDFLRWAVSRNAEVLEGRAFETTGRLPYQPIAEALRWRLRTEPDVRRLVHDTWLAELVQILPELAERCPDLPVNVSTSQPIAQSKLFEAVARVGESIASRGPTILFVDDLQWADAGSFDLLGYVVRAWARSSAPVMILLGLGREEPTSPSVDAWFAALRHDVPVTFLNLLYLMPDDIERMIRGIVGGRRAGSEADRAEREVVAAWAAWLHRETRGHPLLLVETLRWFWEQGRLGPGVPLRAPAQDLANGVDSPFAAPGVREVVRSRLQRLDPNSRAVLAAGAVLGDQLRFEDLCRVAGINDGLGLNAVEELAAHDLIAPGEPASSLSFTHSRIREVVYDDIGPNRLEILHRRALDTLADRGAPAAELARHAEAAGLAERALELRIAAGDAALGVFATQDALGHYQRAGAIAASIDPPTQVLHDLYRKTARAHEITGQIDAARSTYDEMRAAAEEAGDVDMEVTALNGLAVLAAKNGLELDKAADLLTSAGERATGRSHLPALVDIELNLASVSLYRWSLGEGREHGRRALDLAREAGLTDREGRALDILGMIENGFGNLTAAEAHAQAAVDIGRRIGDRVIEADGLCDLSEAKTRQGQPRVGLELATRARDVGKALGSPFIQVRAAHKLALALLEAGAYEQALEVASAGAELAGSAQIPAFVILNLSVRGDILRALGGVEEARDAHETALGLNAALANPPFTELLHSSLAADALRLGDVGLAAEHARAAIRERRYDILYSGLHRWHETAALLGGGFIAEAREDVREFGGLAATNDRYRIAWLRSCAILDVHGSAMEQAEQHLDDALRLADRLGLPQEQIQVRMLLAWVCQARGDSARAAGLAAHATEALRAQAAALQDKARRQAFMEGNRAIPEILIGIAAA